MKRRNLKALLMCLILLLGMSEVSSASAAKPRKIDEISNYNWEQVTLGLDFFALLLQQEPTASGYLIVYDGRSSRRGERLGWMNCIKHYLVAGRQIDAQRFRIVSGGYRKTKTVELWLLTPTDRLPKATPTVKPQDVKTRPGRLRKKDWKSLCAI